MTMEETFHERPDDAPDVARQRFGPVLTALTTELADEVTGLHQLLGEARETGRDPSMPWSTANFACESVDTMVSIINRTGIVVRALRASEAAPLPVGQKEET